jgi:hypothetical protein
VSEEWSHSGRAQSARHARHRVSKPPRVFEARSSNCNRNLDSRNEPDATSSTDKMAQQIVELVERTPTLP